MVEHRQTGEHERIQLRRARVMELRCKGKSLQQITDLWNKDHPDETVSRATIARDVQESLRVAVEENKLNTAQYRELLLARLDQAISSDKFQAQIDRGNVLAIDRLIKITERYAKLVGADAPTKVAQTDPTGEKEAQGLSDEERAARIAELLKRAEERRIEAESIEEDQGENS